MTMLRPCLLALLLLSLPAGIDPARPAFAQDAPAEAAPVNPNPLAAIDPDSLTGFRDRPLFSPTRSRPDDTVTAPEPSAVETPPESMNIRLLGVVGAPEGNSALVLDLDDDTRHSLHQGDMFRGWTVSGIDPSALVLTRNEETQRFAIFDKPAPLPEGDTDPAPAATTDNEDPVPEIAE